MLLEPEVVGPTPTGLIDQAVAQRQSAVNSFIDFGRPVLNLRRMPEELH